jgi:EF hand
LDASLDKTPPQEEPLGSGLIADNEWEMILGEVDLNGDGQISFDEFLEMIFRIFGMQKKVKRSTNNVIPVGSFNGPALSF